MKEAVMPAPQLKTQHNRRFHDFQLEIKSTDGKGEFEGYASVFDVVDSYDEVVAPGAFAQSLKEHAARGTMPALLWQHDPREPIGKWLEMEEDDHGLRCVGQLLIEVDPVAKRAYGHIEAKSISGLSIGYALDKYEVDNDTGIWTLTEIDLWETSIVTFPANGDSRIDTVKDFKSGGTPALRVMERALRDALGLSKSQAKAFLAEGYEGLSGRDAGDDDPLNIADLTQTIRALTL
jgi:Escherichia/Staphylococcus phage prohead protease